MDKESKIYLAGHTGLVGTNLLLKLRSLGYNNLILATRQQLDLTNALKVSKFIEKTKPEYVFICAAKVGGIYANNTYPVNFIIENLKIQTNIIESCFNNHVKKILFLGSSCIYPKFCQQPIKEEYLLSGYLEPTNSAYAIAKIAGIEMCKAYNKQYNTNYISVMPTNLFGLYDNFNLLTSHVLPAMIAKFHNAKIHDDSYVELWGNGSAKRDFLFVEDLCDALVFLMNNYNATIDDYIINVGFGKDITIKELASLIQDIIEYNGDIIWDETKPNGTPRKILDSSKINNLGWKPKTSLYDAIRKTYKWYTE